MWDITRFLNNWDFPGSFRDGLRFKLRQNGICGEMNSILEDFLSDRKQRVVICGQCLSWIDIRAGVSQGSILGLLLFSIIHQRLIK